MRDKIEFDDVLCDYCSDSFRPNDDRSGGFVFGSNAVGPCCAAESEVRIRRYGETQYITARCPEGMPFGQWVRQVLRGGEPGRIEVFTDEDAARWMGLSDRGGTS